MDSSYDLILNREAIPETVFPRQYQSSQICDDSRDLFPDGMALWGNLSYLNPSLDHTMSSMGPGGQQLWFSSAIQPQGQTLLPSYSNEIAVATKDNLHIDQGLDLRLRDVRGTEHHARCDSHNRVDNPLERNGSSQWVYREARSKLILTSFQSTAPNVTSLWMERLQIPVPVCKRRNTHAPCRNYACFSKQNWLRRLRKKIQSKGQVQDSFSNGSPLRVLIRHGNLDCY